MGLPQLIILFEAKARQVMTRSEQGVVLALLKSKAEYEDDKKEFVYYSMADVRKDAEKIWEEKSIEFLKMIFDGKPQKVYAIDTREVEDLTTIFKKYNNKIYQYATAPYATTEQVQKIGEYLIAENDKNHKTHKFVAGAYKGDNCRIINLTTEEITSNGKKYTNNEYSTRIAGLLAGLGIENSSTYYVLKDVENIKELEDDAARDKAIEGGELIIINDGEKFKIARGVNSLTTLKKGENEKFKKIRFIEVIDMIKEDLTKTIKDNYVGKVKNSYQNQLLLLGAVNRYLSLLEKSEVLDQNANNKMEIDVMAKREYLMLNGVEAEKMSVEEIEKYNTGSKVFLCGSLTPLDAMEDFYINFTV